MKIIAVNQEAFGVVWNKAMPQNRYMSAGVPIVFDAETLMSIIPKPDADIELGTIDSGIGWIGIREKVKAALGAR